MVTVRRGETWKCRVPGPCSTPGGVVKARAIAARGAWMNQPRPSSRIMFCAFNGSTGFTQALGLFGDCDIRIVLRP